ncbi:MULTISPECIES: DUF1861 family protein [unclassified Sporolactobacillus]|uniref:DUF1861 family protein n=1 Tax=unclassified Sporolactobacillus TaxID=2628533 RepID=UPI002368858B|nr:DUF1861 family protein [Sporolactobacillus sp. CQH2019]MDD9148999.1 DUF1861 family protein [Sporolactobacillus sp. CQH2019]
MSRQTDCCALLEKYRNDDQPVHEVEKLKFTGVGERDVYNVTAAFGDGEKEILAGRVEPRDSEESVVAFFEKQNGSWQLIKDMPVFPLQDPFVTRIDGMLIFGGVEVFRDGSGKTTWRTVLYKGRTVKSLVPFFRGPEGMKDLRLTQLHSGAILVLTRPQGRKGGRGKIGFFLMASLDELDVRKIEDAPLLEDHFADGEWGGANEIHPLKNGNAGVLGHVAHFDEQGNRHYYSMIFTLNPHNGDHTPVEIIATRNDFIDGPTKREDLKDVVFSGGAIRRNSKLILYAGTSDAEAQKIVLNDPFEKYEQL